jgi:LuxR family transcriptional regulator, maltose regulon positive regulatory protein
MGKSHMGSSPVVKTKLIVPRVAQGVIDRPRLCGLVSTAQSARLIAVTAPAGFGKTTFATAWLAQLRAATTHTASYTAWLSIDAEDNEPARFLHGVACALCRAVEGLEPSAADLADGTTPAAPHAIVAALTDQLTEIDGEVYLVLDDFHCVTDPAIHDAVSLLVAQAPPNFHLALTTRQQLPLALARLRANDALLEIDAAALRFDADETRRFLEHACERRLAPAVIARLYAGTEGWAAALKLAAAALRRGGAAADAWTSGFPPSGFSQPFSAYLDEMLASLPDELVDFATRIAVLDKPNGDLCLAVTGHAHSHALLDDLANRHLLLEPVDGVGHWYRFHRLLLDYLRQRLRARHAEDEPDLHQRAFAWYAQHEMWTDAARHAIAAGEFECALDWLARCGMTLVKRGDLLTLLGWQRQFPAGAMHGQIRLRLAIAWGMALAMREDEAHAMLEEVERDARQQPLEPERADLLCECRVLRAVLLALSDDTAAALAQAQTCVARSSADPWIANVQSNVLRFARWRAGDIEGAYATPWIPYSLEQDRRNVFSSVYHHCLMGSIEMDQGRLDVAQREAREAMRIAEAHAGPHSGAAGFVAPLLADLYYEQDRCDEAERVLVERLPAIDALMSLEGVRQAYAILARISAARDDMENAYALLSHAESLGHHRRWSRLVSGVLLERVGLLLTERRFAEAAACATQLDRLAAQHPVSAACAHAGIHRDRDTARVKLAWARGQWSEAAHLIARLRHEAHALRSVRLSMQYDTLLAITLMASNDADGALTALRAALELAAPAGMSRTILDAGRQVGPLLERLRTSPACTKTLEPCVERLLAAAWSEHARELTTSLSRRELEVLTLIDDGRSNKEVARALGVTPETVKTHLKSVFGKLAVERRAQAAARARSLGLL